MRARLSVFLFLSLFAVSCSSSVENLSTDGPNEGITGGTEAAFLFGTDYISSGQLYLADPASITEIASSGVAGLGSSAVLKIFDGLLYVLHDGFSTGSSDNVQIIDPSDGFATLNQWSTGNLTNPQDIIVDGTTAYITLYSPAGDEGNVDGEGNPGDLLVMDLETGDITGRISFTPYLEDDADVNANASQMVLRDTLLYVLIQDLASDFSPDASGKIAVIDTETLAVTDVITLEGRNPVSMDYSPDSNRLFVANQAPYDFTLGNFDTSTLFGGLEIVDLDDTENTVLINDADLGGYVERVVVYEDSVFAVVSEMDSATFEFTSQIYGMDADNEGASGLSVFLGNSSDVRDIAVDSSGQIWVARRAISAEDGSASDPQVDVFSLETGEQVGVSLVPAVPVVSIAIGNVL